MPVDKTIPGFIRELERLSVEEPFKRQGVKDDEVLRMSIPPYRPIFDAGCQYGHCRGYHLPSFPEFSATYIKALLRNRRHTAKLPKLLKDDKPTPAFLYRLSAWYADGIAHTHLYVTLAQAYESQRDLGFVSMDTRIDCNRKIDMTVVGYGGGWVPVDIKKKRGSDALLDRRAKKEEEAKVNCASLLPSASVGLSQVIKAHVYRYGGEPHDAYGFELIPVAELDRLIAEIDGRLGVCGSQSIAYGDMWHVDQGDLERMRKDRK